MEKKTEKKPLSIKKEVLLLSFLFLVLVLTVFSGIFLRRLYNYNIENARHSLKQCNDQILAYTEGIFHENTSLMELLAVNSYVVNGINDLDAVVPVLESIKRNSNITYAYTAYINRTICVPGYTTPVDFDVFTRPWYLTAMESEGVSWMVYRDAATNEWMFNLCTRILDEDGNKIGVVAIDCSNEIISQQLSTKYQYQSQRSYIIDSNGTVLIHPEEKYINDLLVSYMPYDVWDNIKNHHGNYGEYRKDGIHSIVYLEQLQNSDFMVATAINSSEIFAPILRDILYMLVLVLLISIVLSFALGYLLINRFAQPVIALERRLRMVAAGEPLDQLSFVRSNREMKNIANSIEIIVRDIALREEKRQAAEYLSFHDSMTGIYNRRYFLEEFKRIDNADSFPLCLICCDINGLKLTNDVFGHDSGDELILAVVSSLQDACRHGDILARMGGDEFSILMKNTNAEAAMDAIDLIAKKLSYKTVNGITVSAALGFAIKDSNDISQDDLIQQADAMMYSHKMDKSLGVKNRMLNSILEIAQRDGCVQPLSATEHHLLSNIASNLGMESDFLLKQSYWLRKIGECSAFCKDYGEMGTEKWSTDIGYRVMCAFDSYRDIAGYVLHYTEHWDGSGRPGGLSGTDIPQISRAVAVVDAYVAAGEMPDALYEHREWYDPEILSALERISIER